MISSKGLKLKAKDKDKDKIKKVRINIEKWDELKPEGKRQLLWKRLSKINFKSSVLMVGHEPQLGDIISEIILSDYAIRGHIHLKKCGLAKVKILSFTPKIKGQLNWLITPKSLKKMI